MNKWQNWNVYLNQLGPKGFDGITKKEFATIAFSLAMRICEDDFDKARVELFEELRLLRENEILPQKIKS